MRSGSDLETVCRALGLSAQVIYQDVPTPTVAAAAQAVGCRVDQIVKSILVMVAGEPLVIVTNGERRIDFPAVAARYGVSRKRVRLATSEEVLALTGYRVGALPPFGHQNTLRTLLDPQVLAESQVYAGGGAENALLFIRPEEIGRAVEVEILNVTKP